MVLNSLTFCLFGKLLISPLNVNESIAGKSIFGWRFFPFFTLNILCHVLLMCRVSAEKSADNLMGGPLYVFCYFSLVAFNIFSLSLIFVNLISICLSTDLSYLGLSVFPGIGWLFPVPCYRSFQQLSLQIFPQVLSLSLVLLEPLEWKCWCI